MAWTTPITFVAGNPLLAAELNVVQANLNALKAPPIGISNGFAGSVASTTSTTFANIGASYSSVQVTAGGRVLVIVFGNWHDTGAYTANMDITIDGVRQGDTTNGLLIYNSPTDSAAGHPFCLVYVSAVLSAGSHTIAVQWKTSGGTLTLDQIHFVVREF